MEANIKPEKLKNVDANKTVHVQVMHLIFSRGLAGAERSALNGVSLLHQHGIDVMFNVVLDQRLSSPDAEAYFRQQMLPFPHAVFETDRRFSWRLVGQLKNAFKNASIVHTHCYKSQFYALIINFLRLLVGRSRFKIVATQHGYPNPGFRARMNEYAGDLLRIAADKIIVVSPEIVKRKRFYQWHRDCRFIPNFTPMHRRPTHGSLRDQFAKTHKICLQGTVIGWLGRIEEIKGLALFIDVLAALKQPVTVIVGGEGSQLDACRVKAKDLGLSIHFIGNVTDTEGFYDCLDLFVMSSFFEGTPMVLLEAMDAGIPIVAPNVGGIPDLLAFANHKLMFDVGDSLAFQNVLLHALTLSAGNKQALVHANRRQLKTQYSASTYLEKTLDAYRIPTHCREILGLQE